MNAPEKLKIIIIDTTAPTVSSFTTTKAAGSYKEGEVIEITANTDEPIQSGNEITVTLNDSNNTQVVRLH